MINIRRFLVLVILYNEDVLLRDIAFNISIPKCHDKSGIIVRSSLTGVGFAPSNTILFPCVSVYSFGTVVNFLLGNDNQRKSFLVCEKITNDISNWDIDKVWSAVVIIRNFNVDCTKGSEILFCNKFENIQCGPFSVKILFYNMYNRNLNTLLMAGTKNIVI